jgi:hypothetical protein
MLLHRIVWRHKKLAASFWPAAALSLGFFGIEAILQNTNFSKLELTTAAAW